MKIEFFDYEGNYGYASTESGSYDWYYEGSENDVYEVLINPEQVTSGHIRPDSAEGEFPIDGIIGYTNSDKIKYALRAMKHEELITTVEVDGEIIF